MRGWERRRQLAIASVAAVLGGLLVFAEPAAAGTLTNPLLNMSNNGKSVTGVNYAQALTPVGPQSIAKVTFTVPAGTGGTPSVVQNYGIGAGTVALASNTITYTVTSPGGNPSGIPILIEITGITNTATAGTYASTVTTYQSNGNPIDSASNPNLVIVDTGSQTSVSVAKSLVFTNDSASFQLLLDPGLAALTDQTHVADLTVLTNASHGYSLSVNDSAAGLAVGSDAIPRFSSNGQAGSAVWGSSVNKFGYAVTVTGATLASALSGGKYAGYRTTAEVIASRTNPTGPTADTIDVSNRVVIDFSQAAGTYTDTITYTVTPSY